MCLSHSRFLSLVSFANRISECVVNRQTKAIYRYYLRRQTYTHTHTHTNADIEFKPQADQAHLQLHAHAQTHKNGNIIK